MITENTLDDTVEQTLTPSPPVGQRLRLAREQHHYTQQQVAQRLRLKVATIRSLEEALPPEALFDPFIRGYVRSYARLVQLAEHDVLPTLCNQSEVERVANTRRELSQHHRQRQTDKRSIAITWPVVITLLGLVIGWWWQHCNVAQEELASLTGYLPMQERSAPAPPAPPVTAPVSETIALPITVERVSGKRPVAARTPSDDASARETASPIPVVVAPPARSLAIEVPAAVPAETSHAVLRLQFSGECWLAVRDADGKTLFKGVQQTGDQLHFQSHAHYQLAIGAPWHVKITYRQRSIDLSDDIAHSRVARLSLGPE